MAYIYDDSQTYTGEIVHFTSTDKANITSVSVPLTYSQDLHGYDSPWPAGGGANLWDTKAYYGVGYNVDIGTVVTLNESQTEPDVNNNVISYEISAWGNRGFKTKKLVAGDYTVHVDLRQITNPRVSFYVVGGSDNVISDKYSTTSASIITRTFSVVADSYIVVCIGSNTAQTVVFSDYQIESGSTTSSWQPYSNICPISGRTGLSVYVSPTQDPDDATVYNVDWSTQAGTVYGGTVDVVTGLLTATWVSVDLGTLNFSVWSRNANRDCFSTGVPIRNKTSSSENIPALSSIFTPSNYNATWKPWDMSYTNQNGQIVFMAPPGLYSDANAFKAAMSGVQFCYELATPLTYQLTPNQIAALTENYVWASNGASITVVVSDILHDFQGWLVKVGSDMTLVPTEMIKAETYKVSPNQRMEETAERDSTGVLWRETVPNMPPKIEFNTPAAYDTDVNALNAIFRAAYSNEQERKLTVAFYDPEENVYKSWECYMPNIDFPIRTIDIDAKTIFYDEIRYAFIGY